MASYIRRDFKSILNKRKFIDHWFWDRYSINPYNGCQFGCIYCDSRSQKYHLPTDFENQIIVKNNIASMLDNRLAKARTLLPDIVGIAGTTDPYQPAEKIFKNTQACLAVLQKYNFPVHIVTKSTLVLRDLDLLQTIAQKTAAIISVTITSTDNKISKFLEKSAPGPGNRFAAIAEIKKKETDIQCGVLMIPVIPGFTDSDENLENMVKTAKESGADYIIFGGGMTLRDMQADWFLKHVKNSFPEKMELYEKLYNFKYDPGNYNGNYEAGYSYSKRINLRFLELCEKYKIAVRIKRFIPEDYRKYNYIIAQYLLDKSYINQMMGKIWKNLFWAGHNIQNLKESVLDFTKRNELQKISNVNALLEKDIIEYIGKIIR